MIIEEIHIDTFGNLTDLTLTPHAGLNIVAGDNESGKSTLAAFIRYMLYGFGRAGGTEVGEKKKRIDWQSGRAAGSMTVRVGEKRYRLERITTVTTGARERETYRETSATVDLDNNTVLPAGECPGERFLGVPEQVYLQTAFIGQIGAPRPDGASLSGAIENLLFAGDEHVSLPQALDKLEKLRRALLHKNEKGGELYDLRREEESLSARLLRAQEENAKKLADENELITTRGARQAAAEKWKAARVAEEKTNACLTVILYDKLRRAEENLATAETALIEMNGLPASRLEERDLSELSLARRTVETAETRLREARAAHEACRAATVDEEEAEAFFRAKREGGTEAIGADAGQRAGGVTVRLFAAIGCGALGCLLLLLSLLLPTLAGQAWPLVLGGLFLCAALVFVLLFVLSRRDLAALCRAYGARDYAGLLSRLSALRAAGEKEAAYRAAEGKAKEAEEAAALTYRRALGELDTVVRRFNARLPEGDCTAFLDTLTARIEDMLEKKKEKEADRQRALGTVQALRIQLRGTDEEAAREACPPGPLPAEETLQPAKCRDEVKQYRDLYDMYTRKEQEIERRVLSARAEDPAMLAAALENLRDLIEKKAGQYEACQMAYEALFGAGEHLRQEISPRLSAAACRHMAAMTDGKYDRIGVDGDLSLTVGTAYGTRTPEYVSAGTQDLLYFSLRLSLVDLLYRENPPLCLDESFAHQDHDRLRRAMQTLSDFAAGGHQCFLFTCHRREEEVQKEASLPAAVIRLS